MLLEVKDLTVHYDGVEAALDVGIDVAEGSVVALIGANGAGKSTILRAVSGLVKPTWGRSGFGVKG